MSCVLMQMSLSLNHRMGYTICGQGKDRGQDLPFISNDTSLLKRSISFCCFPSKRERRGVSVAR